MGGRAVPSFLVRRPCEADGRVLPAFVLVLLMSVAPAAAIDYQPPSVAELVGLCDLAVIGRVMEVGDEAVRFMVEEVVLGNSPGGVLEVVREDRWPTGDPRRQPYAPGQRFLLFLRVDGAQGNSKWRIMGLGGEGEVPVEGHWVYFEGRSIPFVESRRHDVHGAPLDGQRLAFDCVLSSVRRYPDCFRWYLRSGPDAPQHAVRLCDDAALQEYRSRSRLNDYLVSETMRRLGLDPVE